MLDIAGMRPEVGVVDALAGGALVGRERLLCEVDDGVEGLREGEAWASARSRCGDAVAQWNCLEATSVFVSAEYGRFATYLWRGFLLNTHLCRLEISHFVHSDPLRDLKRLSGLRLGRLLHFQYLMLRSAVKSTSAVLPPQPEQHIDRHRPETTCHFLLRTNLPACDIEIS